jgi:hypothetical protein
VTLARGLSVLAAGYHLDDPDRPVPLVEAVAALEKSAPMDHFIWQERCDGGRQQETHPLLSLNWL